MSEPINVAIAKGRVMDGIRPLLDSAGMSLPLGDPDNRCLVLSTAMPGLKVTVLRSKDVPTYVEYGAAELGVVGKDVLLEHPGSGVYELLDLGLARCRMVVAGRNPSRLNADGSRVRVATKYAESARRHFARAGRQIELIRLAGSMELAPLSGLADLIVDLADTGDTLKANGLIELEEIMPISARLIVGRAAMKTRRHELITMINRIKGQSGPGE